MIKNLLLFIFICISSVSYGQEICDNGIDDDGDGLIDLNDDECECSSVLPSSLIPNPSFEDRTCCPMENARLDCAVGWIQASAPTTDYVHTCGNYLGNTSIPAFAPLPFPDGQGAVGFRDGQANVGPGYKEYVGACLTESMEVGTSYSLEFYVGFRDNVQGNKTLDIAIFGATDCNRLPFGNGSTNVGCPANTNFYDEIDIQSVSGSNEWVTVKFDFIPTKPYEVIIIGPSCPSNPNYIYSPYFYVDGLTLAETAKFGVPFEDIAGSICNDDLVLSIESEEGESYQWYKDGIALQGENGSTLTLITAPDVAGDYLVVINFPEGCISSKTYNVRVPPYYSEQETTICESEEYVIEETSFTEDGIHEITIQASDGCDSIITLTLNVDLNTFAFFEETYCEGDTYSFLDITTSEAGTYQSITQNSIGCDSIITIDLTEIPYTEGIELPEEIELVLGDSIDITPESYDPGLIEFNWYDAEGTQIGNSLTLAGIKPVNNSIITLIGTDQYGCTSAEQISLRVDKSTINLFLPNIFSPDENRVNDYFSFIPTKAVQSIESFTIYDRWGNQMYKDTPLTNFYNNIGWDGTHKGKDAEQGVYAYMISATFIDGTQKEFVGNLTLIRF